MTSTARDGTATAVPKAARDELYEIIRKETTFEQKAREALELGRQYLDVDNAHLTRIDRALGHWEAIVSTDSPDGRFPPGLELDLEETYCRRTIEGDSQITLHDAPNQGWDGDPAFEAHGLATYHGRSLILEDEPTGTVCFVSEDSRDPFSEAENLFVELITQMLERELESEHHEAQLARQSNLATVLNRVLRHNLKNGMSVIRGYTQLMAEELGNPTYSRTPLDSIDKLLALSGKARELEQVVNADFERKSVEITGLVEDVAQMVRADYPNATITVECEDDVTAAVLPSFERALHELVENAAKHGGETPTVALVVAAVPNAVEIQIVDGGPGLEDEEAEVLKTGSETPLVHGSGLGLWLAHWIITSHGGSIDPTGTEKGTAMVVSVPRKPTANVEEELTKLTQARDQYQAAFEKAYDAMVIVNDDAQIIDANSRASQIYGLDEQALLGQPLSRFFPEEFDFESFWRKSHEEGTDLDTMTLSGADGVERTVEYSAANKIVPGQTLIVSRDITDRVEEQQALRQTTQQLDAVIEASPEPIIALDTNGRIELWNGAATATFGYSETETVGKTLPELDIAPPGSDPSFKDRFERAMAGEVFTDLELVRQTKDGERIDLSISTAPLRDEMGEISGIMAVASNITDLKERERELRETNQRLDLALEGSETGVWDWDMDTDELNWDGTMERLFGLEPGSFEGTFDAFSRRVHPDDRHDVETAVRESIETGERFESTYRIQRDEGEQRWVNGRGGVFPEDCCDRMVGVVRDVTDRKERETELERLRDYFEGAEQLGRLGAWEVTADETVHWTDGTKALHEVDEEFEPSLETALEFYHPEDRASVAEAVEQALATGAGYDIEARLITATDEIRWVRTTGVPLDDGSRVRGYIQDITDQKEREETLRQELEFRRLNSALVPKLLRAESPESAARGMSELLSSSELFECTFVELFDRSVSAVLCGTGPDFTDADLKRIHTDEYVDRVIETGTYHIEDVTEPPDQQHFGDSVPAHEGVGLEIAHGGETLGVLTVHIRPEKTISSEEIAYLADLTDVFAQVLLLRQNASESLAERYETLLEGAPDPVFVADAETGEILNVNEAAETLIGESKGTLIGRHHSTLHPAEDAALYHESFERSQEKRTTVQTLSDGSQPELVTADGDTIPVEITVNTVSLPDGPVMFGIFRNVVLERKAERLEAVASILSHDLRNPLNVAQGRLDLLKEASQSEHIEVIENAHERIETLIEDKLTLARNGDPVGETEPVELPDLLGSCWEVVDTAAATLAVETDRTIQADESRLRQLVENVFRNAIDHGGEDVTITVGDLDGGFYIADDGPGIPDDERDQVFDSGYSTTAEGTGFGLAIVREIVDAHDWEISITESDSGGAGFEITGVLAADE